jgi:anti-sigma-K factor RskA
MHDAPALPPGKVYQAWTLPAGSKKMAPSVTFTPKGGRILLRLPVNASRIAAVAVSVEPAGGSPQPTSKPVFVVLFPSKA